LTNTRTYLDHNATTPLRAEARVAMVSALDLCGSASSIHGDGRAVRKLIEVARHEVAALIGAQAKNVVFCGSATEANNMALCLDWQRDGKTPLRRLAVSAVEHVSVLNGARVAEDFISILPVNDQGLVDLAGVKTLLDQWQSEGVSGLVSVMLANNETGVVQPVKAVADLVHAAGGLVHCDAAQAAGKIAFSINDIGADLLTLSSHKLGGPLGAGALVLASEVAHLANPLLRGGGQEKGRRAGTENAPAIAGFGAAATAALHHLAEYGSHASRLRDELEARLRDGSGKIVFFGEGAQRLPNTSCFAELGMAAETMLIALDLEGISVSSGSACSSGKVKISHVLMAMGVEQELASCAIRVSLGRDASAEDIKFLVTVWTRLRKSLHERKQHRAA
jgi:cysteine desulfurase